MYFTWYFEPSLYSKKHSYVCRDNHYVTNVKSDFSSSILRCSLDPRLIIYSQAIRYRRIITQDEELDFHLENLFSSLVSKGYDPTLIHSVFSKVRTQSQTDLLKEKETPDEGILPFVIPFNTNTKSIGLISNKHWSTIMKDITLNPIHQEKPIMAFKRNRNIRDILVHTKL